MARWTCGSSSLRRSSWAGSVAAAAEAIVRTQPALSRQVQQLKRQLGVTLFDRRQPPLDVDSCGAQVPSAANAVLTSVESARALAEFLAHSKLKRLRMVAPVTNVVDAVSPSLAKLDSLIRLLSWN
ncbi:LysR family transcriptional regulator [Kribbella sp. NPDC050820]|uniref:LysR family transcriptional regulator n=1 Tax=Kribbella sp. NPDC050820 TaxID=3155408 RepID=UPI003401D779